MDKLKQQPTCSRIWRESILNKYEIKINPRAIRDLEGIYEYIAYEKLSSENAIGQVNRIKKAILSLDTFPQSHQERAVGRYANKGYRQLPVDNYLIIFRIDDNLRTVSIITVQYQGKNI